jgi:hypothetical protein
MTLSLSYKSLTRMRSTYFLAFIFFTTFLFTFNTIVKKNYFNFNKSIGNTDTNYSLGNIIDAWYYNAYVSNEIYNISPKDAPYVSAIDLVADLNNNTFGKYITTITPYAPLPNIPDLFLSNSGLWWFHSYNIIKAIYPYCNKSLRHAIAGFDWKFTDIIESNIDPDTCVIHMRLGDFLKWGQTVQVSDLLNALDRLPRIPKRVEILNGGKFHFSNRKTLIKTTTILNSLEKGVRAKFPKAKIIQIKSKNADADFYRAVNAPMLVTGSGSFAIMAAVANKNFRLTPALKRLDHYAKATDIIATEYVYEEWYTYEIAP